MQDRPSRVLVLGATGYVGGRLVPELIRSGFDVRCMTRTPQGLSGTNWAHDVEVVGGDLSDLSSIGPAFDGVDQVVYLVHSLGVGDDFMQQERVTAHHARLAAERGGVRHLVYVGGLGDDGDDLSPHLRSRHDVGVELASGTIPVTELRAAIILGAGSASFEMLRSLVEVLPAMLAPRWVTQTRVQPIAIADLLTYLVHAVARGPGDEHHDIVEVGSPDEFTYRGLMHAYADVAGLRRRWIIPVPFLTPRLSAHWVNVVTPLPKALADSLIGSLKNDVIVTNLSATALSDHEPMAVAVAIEAALSAVEDLDIPTRWSGYSSRQLAARPAPWDPDWAGGTVYEDCRTITVDAAASDVQRVVRGIGGERGWYGFGGLWAMRGALDKLFGGVGLRRGRRHPDDIAVGEALDFWRVDAIEDDVFRLHAEMKVPGDAWLEWRTSPALDGPGTVVTQRARFVPRGILGRAYWWVLVPFHAVIFPAMLRRMMSATVVQESDSITVVPTDQTVRTSWRKFRSRRSVLPVSSSEMSDVPVRLTAIDLDPHTLVLEGEIDAHTAPDLAARYVELPAGDGDFFIDMSQVDFMDSSGLRVVIELHQRAEQTSRRLVLRSPSQPVVRLIEVSGLNDHLHVG